MNTNLKEQFTKITNKDIDGDYIENIKKSKCSLSRSEKDFLTKIFEKFKEKDREEVLKAIRLYSIWEPDEAITKAREKGVFRYRAYKTTDNRVLYLLERLIQEQKLFLYSKKSISYLSSKKELSWLHKFYIKSEEKIIKYIKQCHKSRTKIISNNYMMETSIFKDLLVYIDFNFKEISARNERYRNPTNIKNNNLDSYSKEEVVGAISYIIYLYKHCIGIDNNCNYIVDSNHIISNELNKIIALACKINQLEEWELYIDLLNYSVDLIDNKYIIKDNTEIIEKSIRMGYINTNMQRSILYSDVLTKNAKSIMSINHLTDYIVAKLESEIIKEVGKGKLNRYRFEFPLKIIEILNQQQYLKSEFFEEEIVEINYIAKELAMPVNKALEKSVTQNCKLIDIIYFKRFFLIINGVINKILLNKEKEKVLQSLVPAIERTRLVSILTNFMADKVKIEELLDLFTYNNSNKLDLFYTPFFKISSNLVFSNTIVSNSNLLRNSIAHSYAIKNQEVNKNEGYDNLVSECEDIFKACEWNYDIQTNKKYKYKGKNGEIDVVVISEEDILIIECKCPLMSTSNFEMRASLQHIEKANRQLDFVKEAFQDEQFRKIYFENWGIEYKNQNIKTCIVFGNRLFSGVAKNQHPIRYIYELDMVLNRGIIESQIAEWSIWEGEKFSHKDLVNFLSIDKNHIKFSFESMDTMKETMYVGGKNITLQTYLLNIHKCMKLYDENLRVIKCNDELKLNIQY